MKHGKHILLFGATGQVGKQFLRVKRDGYHVLAVNRAACDLTSAPAIRKVILEQSPNWVVNAAAYTAVDKAETDAEICSAVNATAPGVMAAAAKECGARLIHYSTDYVFDGEKQGEYREDDLTHPLGVYGQTKLEGEKRIAEQDVQAVILRTSWVYGAEGHNFLRTMLRLGTERPELRVVADQRGAPTSARAIADATWRLITATNCEPGVYHMTAGGSTTWFGFAERIFKELASAGAPVLVPIATSEYPTPAKRPKNSVLCNDRFEGAFGFRLQGWEQQLAEVLAELKEYEPQHSM